MPSKIRFYVLNNLISDIELIYQSLGSMTIQDIKNKEIVIPFKPNKLPSDKRLIRGAIFNSVLSQVHLANPSINMIKSHSPFIPENEFNRVSFVVSDKNREWIEGITNKCPIPRWHIVNGILSIWIDYFKEFNDVKSV